MASKIKNGDTVLFIGDSITDCGRRDNARPYGNGYVSLFTDLMALREPRKAITVINRGIGGNTVNDLRGRWHDDVITHAPQWLSIKIGINDLHQTLFQDVDGLDPESFEIVYDGLLGQVRKELPTTKILLIDPFYMSTDPRDDSMRGRVRRLLPEYAAAIKRLAGMYKCRHVETQAMFDKLLKHHRPDRFGVEPVHPQTIGHLAIAEAVYAALS
ncbi:MAG: SGNH/GDSL hydrolase family protein [Planctomycetota bacterium]|jgi:lysophospholipase L1-like esterase|nr:SGNH/GDSL hydrolase family protein [Planctomycetota bacterium]